ncbi:MAG TPA: bifunctional phosphoglucose/phosphomannose isomerase [Edaphocola sp.]|nr:bifunctional phosphoglucose/phosphomannose isomerase [Edaphocola sp.]
MDKLIELFSEQLIEALSIGKANSFRNPDREWRNVVVSGLGGSGIGGTIVQNYVTPTLPVPFVVNKTYDLPAFAGAYSLVIICSYSGNTEETISAFQQALERDAFVVCITSGGRIAEMAAEHRVPCFKIPGGMPPRACLGYSLVQVLFALHYAGLTDDRFVEEINKAITLLQQNKEGLKQTATGLAQKAYGKLPVIYAGCRMEGVAVRWRQQLNENSKLTAWENVVPEMNHNELVGWKDVAEDKAVFFLHSGSDHPQVKTRMGINKTIIERCTGNVLDVEAMGGSYWEQAFSLIHIGDWLSWYLADLRQVDAMEVKVIDYLKKELAGDR